METSEFCFKNPTSGGFFSWWCLPWCRIRKESPNKQNPYKYRSAALCGVSSWEKFTIVRYRPLCLNRVFFSPKNSAAFCHLKVADTFAIGNTKPYIKIFHLQFSYANFAGICKAILIHDTEHQALRAVSFFFRGFSLRVCKQHVFAPNKVKHNQLETLLETNISHLGKGKISFIDDDHHRDYQ